MTELNNIWIIELHSIVPTDVYIAHWLNVHNLIGHCAHWCIYCHLTNCLKPQPLICIFMLATTNQQSLHTTDSISFCNAKYNFTCVFADTLMYICFITQVTNVLPTACMLKDSQFIYVPVPICYTDSLWPWFPQC